MRAENLSEKVVRLEREIESLAQETSEEKQQQWRFRRGDLAQAQYELFLELETQRPLLAVQLLYKSATIGNSKARDRLLTKKPESESVVKEYEQAKSKLSTELSFVYGLQALAGVGIKPNDFSAVQYFQFAAEKGYLDAQTYLGWMYKEGRGVAQDEAQAVAWYRPAAEQGDANAQNNLGWMYQEGRGVAQDEAQAVAWFRRAAEQGHAVPQSNLGWLYQQGRGVDQDDVQAVAWFRRAAEQGYMAAQANLGWMYLEGRGVARDDVEAVGWYRRAAEQGDAIAQNSLGLMYHEGRGLAQDDVQAVAWYRRAAEQGNAAAQVDLGWMYKEGHGLAQDDVQAVAWYRRAAEQGNAIAQNNLGFMYQHGRGVAQDDVQAVTWYRRAAEQGLAAAQENLGWMYEQNRINPNPDEAIDYRKDFQLGVQAALVMLEQCSRVSSSAKYHCHLAQSNISGIREMLEKEPNEFFEALMTDTLLSQEARVDWLERLFGEQHRPINRFEIGYIYNKRPKLKPEYLMTLNMEVARNRYAVLATSQLPNKREETNITEVEEIKWLANKLESQKREIEELIKILNTMTEDHPAYPEAQLILSHLHFRLDQEGSQWKQHFAKCEEVDKENQWIGRQIIPNWIHFEKSCVIIQEYLEALLSKDETKVENLLKKELLEVAQDRYAIEPLLRLSIMAKNPEKFESCVSSLKALGLDEEEIEEKAQSILTNKSYV